MSPIFLSRVRIRNLLLLSICTALVIAALFCSRHQRAATTIVVNSTSDVVSAGDNLCTLREAIIAANTNTISGATAGECAPGSSTGSDIISITVNGTINLTGPLPEMVSDMTINGPGSAALTVRRDTGGNYRVFRTNNRNVD